MSASLRVAGLLKAKSGAGRGMPRCCIIAATRTMMTLKQKAAKTSLYKRG